MHWRIPAFAISNYNRIHHPVFVLWGNIHMRQGILYCSEWLIIIRRIYKTPMLLSLLTHSFLNKVLLVLVRSIGRLPKPNKQFNKRLHHR